MGNTNAVAMTGDDTFILNDNVFTDFADGDIGVLDFDGDVAAVKKGKNGNTIYALNTMGLIATFTLRLLKTSGDDIFLNNLLTQQNTNFAAFPLMIGQFIKKVRDGQGNITNDIYVLSGGIFMKNVGAKSNVEGDVDQSVSIYRFKFSNAPRNIVG